MRSQYDCLLTTSKTINDDNPLLNCRIEGLEKKTPDLIILDRLFNVKKNSLIFKKNNRKIYILTNSDNLLKKRYLKRKGVITIKLKKESNYVNNLKNVFYEIKKLHFNRILVETGLTFLNQLIKHNLIKNFYLFKSSKNLGANGFNNSDAKYLKNVNFFDKNKININLKEDSLYKIKI